MEPNTGIGWGAFGAVFGTAITAIFAWMAQRNKGQVEETVAVRQQWEKLTGSLATRLSTVEREFAEYRQQMAKQIADMEQRHAAERREERRRHDAELRAMRELNEGLQRQIAQNSQSVAHRLGDPEGTAVTKAARKSRGDDTQ